MKIVLIIGLMFIGFSTTSDETYQNKASNERYEQLVQDIPAAADIIKQNDRCDLILERLDSLQYSFDR